MPWNRSCRIFHRISSWRLTASLLLDDYMWRGKQYGYRRYHREQREDDQAKPLKRQEIVKNRKPQ